jgi:hypothetical protein
VLIQHKRCPPTERLVDRLEVDKRVDVTSELGHVDGDEAHGGEARCAAGAVDRLERARRGDRQRVRRSIRCCDERHARRGQARQRGGRCTRQVGVDDKARPGETVEADLDRAPLPAAWIGDDLHAKRSSRIRRFDVSGHDPHLADAQRRLDDVDEHRESELAPQRAGQARLPPCPERDHRDHDPSVRVRV